MTDLSTLADRFWTAVMAHSPTSANLHGDHRFDDQIEDVSLEAENAFIDQMHSVIAAAEEIDELDGQDDVTRRMLVHEARSQLLNPEERTTEFLVDPMLGAHVLLLSYAPQLTSTNANEAGALVERAGKIGGLMDQLADRHRQGIAHGRTPPEILVEKTLAQLDRYLDSPIEEDPWLQLQPPPSFGEDEIAAWRDQFAAAVAEEIRPGYERYREAVRNEVAPAARTNDQCGVCWLPQGAELYSRAISKYTSLDLPPEEIHAVGVEVMNALSDEYRQIGARALGSDDLRDIYARLRDDPDLRFDSKDDIIAQAEGAVQRAEQAAPEYFDRFPGHSCRVQPLPELEAEEAPLAYYMPPSMDGSRPGTFFINTIEPSNVTRYESEALAFHEGVPGHHFQVAIAQEIEGLPDFRKHALLFAYVEGWGLYTERLADEMGLYSGDLERMGMLSFDSWRAGRLVVDTGMHALGWSRNQAIEYLTENSPQQRHNIENEVDRYIGYFGQALSYMIGRREIMRLREDAEGRLGESFDIKGFHEVVLGSGPVTLPILGGLVDDWVSSAA